MIHFTCYFMEAEQRVIPVGNELEHKSIPSRGGAKFPWLGGIPADYIISQLALGCPVYNSHHVCLVIFLYSRETPFSMLPIYMREGGGEASSLTCSLVVCC